MKCAKIYHDLGAFVLGGLEPEEAAEIRRHLAFCSSCRNELQELEKINQALEAAPPSVDPPGYLKEEILSRVRGEGSSSSNKESSSAKNYRFILPTVAAALVTIVALGIFFGLQAESPVATVQLLPTPELRDELRAEGEDYWGVAEVYPQPSGSQLVELKLNNLEKPEPDSFYEMWFVSGEKYVGAGAFTTTGAGETKVWLTAPPEARDYTALLVTKEPVAGDPASRKQEILRGEVL
jgi:anti-sigma-K factor RskA